MEFRIVNPKTRKTLLKWKEEQIKKSFMTRAMDNFNPDIAINIRSKKKAEKIKNSIMSSIYDELMLAIDKAWDETIMQFKEETKRLK